MSTSHRLYEGLEKVSNSFQDLFLKMLHKFQSHSNVRRRPIYKSCPLLNQQWSSIYQVKHLGANGASSSTAHGDLTRNVPASKWRNIKEVNRRRMIRRWMASDLSVSKKMVGERRQRSNRPSKNGEVGSQLTPAAMDSSTKLDCDLTHRKEVG